MANVNLQATLDYINNHVNDYRATLAADVIWDGIVIGHVNDFINEEGDGYRLST